MQASGAEIKKFPTPYHPFESSSITGYARRVPIVPIFAVFRIFFAPARTAEMWPSLRSSAHNLRNCCVHIYLLPGQTSGKIEFNGCPNSFQERDTTIHKEIGPSGRIQSTWLCRCIRLGAYLGSDSITSFSDWDLVCSIECGKRRITEGIVGCYGRFGDG